MTNRAYEPLTTENAALVHAHGRDPLRQQTARRPVPSTALDMPWATLVGQIDSAMRK